MKQVCFNILKILTKMFLVLLAVSMVCFALVSASPVDPISMFVGEIGTRNMNAETLAKLEAYFGLNTPAPLRYLNWLFDFIRGDMGISLIYRQPVRDVIWGRFLNSFALMLTAWLFSGVLGFTLGVVAGVFQGKIVDKLIKGYSLLMASTPTFWLALVLLMIFAVWLKILPIGLSVPLGVDAYSVTFFDVLRHMILPVLTLSVVGVANITLHTREKMISVMQEDYVLFARARGEGRLSIVLGHGIRNVIIPALTLQFASVGEIFGGSILVEQVFSYPGLGQAAVNAGLNGDAPLLLGVSVIGAALVFCGNLSANILYGVIDPRVRRGQRND